MREQVVGIFQPLMVRAEQGMGFFVTPPPHDMSGFYIVQLYNNIQILSKDSLVCLIENNFCCSFVGTGHESFPCQPHFHS